MSNSKQKIFRIPRTRPYFYLTRGVYRGGARGNAPPNNCEGGGRGACEEGGIPKQVEVKLKPLRTLRR